ncbi:MAG: AraC family transcriptional regulator [Ruminococcaceae bacterium]|nr:AraC family transcriptional regulator [Oscillospiraceae bacterium]
MAIRLDHQLREQIPKNDPAFPITFFCDEFASLPNRAGPLHWHPEFEIATAALFALDFQVGQEHIILEAGDSIFVNGNILHGIRQIHGDIPEPMPNIVFASGVIASEISAVHQKYIQPISTCDSLPYIVFRNGDGKQAELNLLIREIYQEMRQRGECCEMIVQRNLSRIFEYMFRNLDTFPRARNFRIQITAQVRIQKMLSYIYEHYMETVTLEDIARAADIGKSEAGRCFNMYMGCSPVEALIRYRLQIAHRLLNETNLTLQEISFECGFHSVNYFSRQFRKNYGCAPGNCRLLGK